LSLYPLVSFAQQDNLNVTADKIQPAGDTWTTTLTVTFSTIPQNGIFIEIPAVNGFHLIPVSITRNEKHFWLQNSAGTLPSADSIMTWQMTDSGFFLYFYNSPAADYNNLTITCIAHLQAPAPGTGSEIRVRSFSGEPGNRQISTRIIAAQAIDTIFKE
jgi:hypothetical protein